MKVNKGLLYIVFVLVISTGCETSSSKTHLDLANSGNKTVENESVQSKAIDQEQQCVEAIRALVLSSNYNNPLMTNIAVEEIIGNKINIKITHTNERGENTPVGWLMLDKEKGQLVDITNDPDEPIKMIFDKIELEKVKQLCW